MTRNASEDERRDGSALGYGWVTSGALQLTFGRRAFMAVQGDSLVVVHDGLLGEPLVVRRDDVEEMEVSGDLPMSVAPPPAIAAVLLALEVLSRT